ncbi:testis-specific gene 10 protein [Conger conger]|uniref:testis-specific gene 10 protein n=1 Tax=Conger conger TaxID=82655 RepID=UPI002A5A9EBF|nr:testis-specific gene 10 protein [Conger conger]
MPFPRKLLQKIKVNKMDESTSDMDKQESPLSETEKAGTNEEHRSISSEPNHQDVSRLQQKGQVSGQVGDLTQEDQQLSRIRQEDQGTLLDTASPRAGEAEERVLARHRLDQLQTKPRRRVDQNQNQNLRGSVRQLQRERDALANQLGKLQLPGAERERVRRCEGGGARGRGARLDSFVRSVEEDRDFYKREAERLQSMLRPSRSTNGPRGPPRPPPAKSAPVQGAAYDSELMRLLREREDLQALLDKYERHLSEIQGNVKVLSADRDKTSLQYQKAQEEIAHLRREVMKSKSPRTQKSTLTAQSILKRVESEREEASTDLKRMTTERDSLRERLKISQETAISERAHLEQRVEDLQTAIYTLEQEQRDLKTKQALMKDTMIDLEEEVSSRGHKLAATEGDLNRSRKECSVLRLSGNQLETALSDSQLRLTARFGELQTAQDKNKQLEERNDTLLRQVSGLRDEVGGLQSAMSELDQRKSSLQGALERESDLLASATTQLDEKDRLIRGLKVRVDELQASAEGLREQVCGREQDAAVLRRKLADAEEELGTLARMKDGALRENSLLREDLDKARLDQQALQLRLEESSQEGGRLQRTLADCNSDVSRLEVLLTCKEKECVELQEAQRRAEEEAGSWEERARQTEGALSSLRVELTDSESERRRLKDALENQELKLQETLVSERSCNGQIAQLNRSLLLAEDDLRLAQSERSSTMSDLEKTRELCVKLDSSKEVVLRELDVCRSEVELLRKQLASERLSMKSLESMLQTTREKSCTAPSLPEQHHIQLLRNTAPQRLFFELAVWPTESTQGRELIQLRIRSEQLESSLDVTQRQLSSERFERERAVQELRLQGLSPSLRSSSPTRRPLSPRHSWSPERTFQSSPERLAAENPLDRSLVFRDPYI